MSDRRSGPFGTALSLLGDEPTINTAHVRRATQRLNSSLAEMQLDLDHFASTIVRLRDANTTSTDVSTALQSSQAVVATLEAAYNRVVALRTSLQQHSESGSMPLSAPTPVHPSTAVAPSVLPSSAEEQNPGSVMTNDWERVSATNLPETSPAEERAAHYAARTQSNLVREPEEELQRILADPSIYLAEPPAPNPEPPTQRGALYNPEEEGERRFNYGRLGPTWTSAPTRSSEENRLRVVPNRAFAPLFRARPNSSIAQNSAPEPSTSSQPPSSTVQFVRQTQSRTNVPRFIYTDSSSSSSSSSVSSNSSIDGSDSPPLPRLLERLSTLQETTRRLRAEVQERRLRRESEPTATNSNNQRPVEPRDTLVTLDPPTRSLVFSADARAHLLRRRILTTAPPWVEEENKENVEIALDANGDPSSTPSAGVRVRHYGSRTLLSTKKPCSPAISAEAPKEGHPLTSDTGTPWPLPNRPRVKQPPHCELEVALPRGMSPPVICT